MRAGIVHGGFDFLPVGSIALNNRGLGCPTGVSAIRQVDQIADCLCLIDIGFLKTKSGEIHSLSVNSKDGAAGF